MQHRVAVFMDWANLWPRIKLFLENDQAAAGKAVDYSKLLAYFRKRGFLIGVHMYMVEYPDSENAESQKKVESVKYFIRYLRRAGFRIRTKFPKILSNQTTKANCDIEIAVDILSMALRGRVDEVILGSADSDFKPLIEEVQKIGVRTVVMGPRLVTSTELRECYDEFLPLENVLKEVLKDRPKKEKPDSELMDNTLAAETAVV